MTAAASTLYDSQKARELTRLTQEDDMLRYLQFALLPVFIITLLVFLLRRAA
ncbi:MAG: hypothetical protein HS117_13415 [Verrucomicrobiaceae bacterium]|nr:hypothetical protein [Verrucomicrobiaceae bacterium]